MSLNVNFVISTINLLQGSIISPGEAEKIIKLLGSSEELLAWIILRRNFDGAFDLAAKKMKKIALQHAIKAAPLPANTPFPKEKISASVELRNAIKSSLAEFERNSTDGEAFYQIMAKYKTL